MARRDPRPGQTNLVPPRVGARTTVVLSPLNQFPAAIERASVQAYVENETAAGTRRAYRSDARIFATWCIARDLAPLPASPETVAAFLASDADSGTKASTLGRRMAAISYAHRLAGFASPTDAELVRITMRGIRRTIGAVKVKKAPATAGRLADMLAQVPDTLAGKRDRALLLLGFACALRRSELVALTMSDLEHTPDGLLVTIRRSKTDQEGVGAVIAVPAGGRLRVTDAVADWLAAATITTGPIFRPVNRHGAVLPGSLSGFSVAAIVKTYAGLTGLDAASFAGHSLRRGFLTSAAQHGATLAKMKAVSRHKSVDVLMGYVEDAERFTDHAGAGFL